MEKIQKLNEEYKQKFGQRELVLNKLLRIRQLASKIYNGTLIIQKQDYYKEKNEKEKEIIYMRGEYGNIYKLKYNLSLCENAYVAFAKHNKDSNKDSNKEIRLNKILLLLKNA
jgi:ABC-type arginine transport system ATPase subunit